jgi:hypothetical protein
MSCAADEEFGDLQQDAAEIVPSPSAMAAADDEVRVGCLHHNIAASWND